MSRPPAGLCARAASLSRRSPRKVWSSAAQLTRRIIAATVLVSLAVFVIDRLGDRSFVGYHASGAAAAKRTTRTRRYNKCALGSAGRIKNKTDWELFGQYGLVAPGEKEVGYDNSVSDIIDGMSAEEIIQREQDRRARIYEQATARRNRPALTDQGNRSNSTEDFAVQGIQQEEESGPGYLLLLPFMLAAVLAVPFFALKLGGK
eukprot:TRINITY_DN867_c6_g1_i1.p1 TRINITY_DN867_c6_g1~~TRINITY_DN867_c6_g1_i1.p1  ORF type:complete len:204 (-),score=16.31 TRINITY_DN867_c6_g1_i1:357-968(-)